VKNRFQSLPFKFNLQRYIMSKRASGNKLFFYDLRGTGWHFSLFTLFCESKAFLSLLKKVWLVASDDTLR
jgi:hypothetical protein